MKMPGWYDIVSPSTVSILENTLVLTCPQHTIDGNAESLRKNEDEAGILLSKEYLHGLIKQEVDAGIPPERIVIGGFSQGGAMSIFSGLTAKFKLAGIIGLSSYLLLSLKFADLVPKPALNQETPIFMAHGDEDQVVNYELGKKSYDLLKELGFNATFKTYL